MPIDYKRYHKDWKAIRAEVLERAGDRCEECGVLNYDYGARDRFGKWHTEVDIDGMKSDDGEHLWPDGYPKIIRIVLTISHTDHDINNNGEPGNRPNLKALCQRCHLLRFLVADALALCRWKRKSGMQELF